MVATGPEAVRAAAKEGTGNARLAGQQDPVPAQVGDLGSDRLGGGAQEALAPLPDSLVELGDMQASGSAAGIPGIGVIVAPLTGLDLVRRPGRLGDPAVLPVQQPDSLRTDQHQAGRAAAPGDLGLG